MGVVKLEPEPNKVPPDALLYHSYVPPGPVAVTIPTLPLQIVVPDAVGADGIGFTVTITAVLGLMQPSTVVCT